MNTERITIDDGFQLHTFQGQTTYTGTTIATGGANIETYTVSIPALGLTGLAGEWDGNARHNVMVEYTREVRRAMRRPTAAR